MPFSNVVIPQVFNDYLVNNSPEKTAFFQSGIVQRNQMLDAKANSGGNVLNVPLWNDLNADSAPNISSDNPADIATADTIDSGEQIARIAYLNKGWTELNLAGEIAGSSPNQRIAERVGDYWIKQWQRRLIASALGAKADNVANDSSDMVIDVSTEDGDNATSANLFSRQAFTSTIFTLGDMYDTMGAISVHPVIYKRMLDNNDIDFKEDSAGNMTIPTYLGLRVILDGSMPVEAGGTSGFKYTSILFGNGVFGYGEGMPRIPIEIESSPEKGQGGGVETLWSRKTWLLHLFGYQFTSASVAGVSATEAELKLAANWDRVVERNNVPLAFLVTNG